MYIYKLWCYNLNHQKENYFYEVLKILKVKDFEQAIDNCSFAFPSLKEIEEDEKTGANIKNALEYEKAYKDLIEQVKDKPYWDKVNFLKQHVAHLKGNLSLFSKCRDFMDFNPEEDEVLARVMLYRYEHNISILDDEECAITKDVVAEYKHEMYSKRGEEKAEKLRKMKVEEPQKYAQLQKKLQKITDHICTLLERCPPITKEEYIAMAREYCEDKKNKRF